MFLSTSLQAFLLLTTIHTQPRSVTETDDKEFSSLLEDLERQNQEVPGDDPESESDDE